MQMQMDMNYYTIMWERIGGVCDQIINIQFFL